MKSIQIQLTSLCNQKCIMCRKYTWPKKQISLSILETILAKYKDCTFSFSGGEPLLYEDLSALNKLLAKYKITYQIFTTLNFNFLSTAQDKFLENADCIQVSLDGSTHTAYNSIRNPQSGGFYYVLQNSKWLKDMHKNIKFNCTLSSKNYVEIIGLSELAFNYDIPIRFYPVHTHDNLTLKAKHLQFIANKILLLEMQQNEVLNNTNLKTIDLSPQPFIGKCYVKNHHMVIDEDGIAYPCCRAINDNGDYIKDKYSIDNLTSLDDENKLYAFCKGCDRYKKFNTDWQKFKNENKLYL